MRYSQSASANSGAGFRSPPRLSRQNDTPQACFLCRTSSRIKSMVGWMGQPSGWPDDNPGTANPVQFTTSKFRSLCGD
nr:ash family protein [Sodalis glossinidius]